MPYPLEPTPEDAHAMGLAALEFAEAYVGKLADLPASVLDDAHQLAADLREPAPEHGRPFPELLDTVARGAASGVTTAGPGYLAYIPGGGLYASVLATFLAAAANKYVTVWSIAPAFAQLEATAIRWLCDLFDYPATARGILTSGGSLANFSAIATARAALLPENFLSGTIYVTAQTHASCAKAAKLAGFPPANTRPVPTLDTLAMNPAALEAMIEEDRRAGRQPFLVIGTAGTTNTGAIDPLHEVGQVARRHALWFHVDAAYGGPFQLTERGRAAFHGIETADSITLDPHKAMFLPYGTGALLVRDGTRLRAAHHVGADYLQDLDAEEDIPNFTEYSPELTRRCRGLGLWLPIKLHGLSAFRNALDEKLDLARFAYTELVTAGFEAPWEPPLSTVAFRLPSTDSANQNLLRRVNASGRVFISSTLINGRFFLRLSIVSHRTHRDRVEEALRIIGHA
ncbi:pyridoxal phosphate-dependent decarboxylase family protein [Nonomuraea typhae]|uniref:pyridoxal phosphate-dependent decarboxylase family protein n=1 Tax=Nonomuraea typhae TaxID=2603600 RepID=UPI0012F70884|nr:aminotransferase class V-fold PLP-dependent enzyme [Nonomuraea typhae]